MDESAQNFESLLTEVGLEYRPTPDFVPCTVSDNNVFRYQHAMRSPSGALEMRYRIDSFVSLSAEREALSTGLDELASVSPDQMVMENFLALIVNLSNGHFVAPTVFKPEHVELLYGADWSALCFLRLANKEAFSNYDSAYVLGIRKRGVANVYVLGLYRDAEGATQTFDKEKLPLDVKKYLVPSLRFL